MLRQICVALLAGSFALSAVASDDISKVNGSIRVEEGKTVGDLDTVNGSIRLGENGRAANISTVNGSVEIGDGASADSAETVNGRISLGNRARIAKGIDTVNGALTLGQGADVAGIVSNVNGGIRLTAAHVGGGIKTVSGDIEIGADSRVEVGILVDKSNSWFFSNSNKPLRVVIGPRAVVEGRLEFRRDVELYVSDTARIGNVTGATPIKFSGDKP
jgi:DUF4097 and DUF4098 domain-containing protein YvlB